jgi:transposase
VYPVWHPVESHRRGGVSKAVHEAVASDALVSELIDAMLNALAALWKEYYRLHALVVKLVAAHELWQGFMQIPGVGPVAALNHMAAIDDPFCNSSREVKPFSPATAMLGFGVEATEARTSAEIPF